jgi:quercetin dioxygenase-like cupin family protein
MIMVDERLGVAMLRFSPGATIDEHAAPHDIDVVCLEGAGYTSVDGERWVLHEGQVIRWPRERRHRLWTEQSSMITLMLERLER